VTRVFIGHGDKDGVTSYQATKTLAKRLPVKDKEFKTYAGYYHRRKLCCFSYSACANCYSAR
jgi:acylglycerol lipase